MPTPYDVKAIDQLQKDLGLRRLTSVLLHQRGIADKASADDYLTADLDNLHDPHLLPDYAKAASILTEVAKGRKKLYIHGDYDVDGVTSTALLTRFFSKLGAEVMHHVPHRDSEGYGIHADSVTRAAEFGADVFLTCDCGITAFEQVQALKDKGMTVVVTDHHEPHRDLPAADAIMNPHLPDSIYPYPHLSGAGVAYKLCLGLVRDMELPEQRYHSWYLEYAALGTIADVMPLTGENRIIAAHGLKALQGSQRPGTTQLMRVADIKGDKPITARDVGFRLGPRLNAAGRVDHAKLALQLLLTNELSEAYELANHLDKLNNERRNRQNEIMDEVLAMIDDRKLAERHAIVLGSSNWEAGLIGIVAGRIKDRFHRPAFVLSSGPDGISKCSARSIPGYPLHELIERLGSIGVKGGGHAVAAGFSVSSSRLEDLLEAIEEDAKNTIPIELLTPREEYSLEVSIDELDLAGQRELESMEPFGMGNPEPRVVLRDVTIEHIDPTRTGEHWRVTLSQKGASSNMSLMIFDGPKRCHDWKPGISKDLLVTPCLDRFRGSESPTAKVHDWRSVSA